VRRRPVTRARLLARLQLRADRPRRPRAITKVIAGEDEEVVEQLAAIYGAVTNGGMFRAASIKGGKVIENAQRGSPKFNKE
jgi:UDP-N-acetyl-D-mannosaminuronate dehydrogenase